MQVEELGGELESEGYKPDFSSGDPIYEAEDVKVLFPRESRPWVTVQKIRLGNVVWYNDFTLDTPMRAFMAFMKNV